LSVVAAGPIDGAGVLDPQIASYLERIAAAGAPRTPDLTPEQARERLRRARGVAAPSPPMVAVEDLVAPGPGGPLHCRLYRPIEAADLLIVFFHGGGWVVGDLETADGSARRLAVASGADVLSVEYRLAPEHPFPAAVRDAEASVAWARERLAGHRRLVLAGDSAGGTLAILAALCARDLGFPVDAQLIAYPVVDCDLDRPSYEAAGDLLPLRRAEMAWYWDHYLPDPARRRDPAATPLHADLEGAPPTVLVQAGHDPLVEEGRDFATALDRAGVPLRRLEYPGAVHGFLGMPGDLAIRDRALAEMAKALHCLLAECSDHRSSTTTKGGLA
jgi:acetyl esterase